MISESLAAVDIRSATRIFQTSLYRLYFPNQNDFQSHGKVHQ